MLLRGKREFYIFHTLCKKNKKQKKRQKWVRFFGSSFFCQKKKRDKKETEFFSKQKLHSFLHLLLVIISTLLWCLSTTFRRPQRKFLRVLLSKNTEREREREVHIFLFLKRRREL